MLSAVSRLHPWHVFKENLHFYMLRPFSRQCLEHVFDQNLPNNMLFFNLPTVHEQFHIFFKMPNSNMPRCFFPQRIFRHTEKAFI